LRVFILDEIVVKPGLAPDYRAAYRDGYMPGARRRGMRLEGAWQSPPAQDYAELPATLYYLWSVDDTDAWWAMRMSRNADGADERFDKLAWWQGSEHMIVSRKRALLSPQPEEA
jgi:hypothetical protein